MRHRHAVIMSVLMLLAVVTAHAAPRVLVLNTTGLPPINTPDQRGFLDLVVGEALSRMGMRLRTVRLPAERGLMNANAGIEDGEMSRIAGLERLYPNLVRVPEKVFDWDFVAFARRPIRLDRGWASLKSYSVGIITGWKIYEINVPPGTWVVKVRGPDQLFRLLQRGRVDIILYEKWNGRYRIQRARRSVIMLHPRLARRAMFIYLHKRHRALVPRLAAVLREMKRDGTYQRLYRRLIGTVQHENKRDE